MIYFVTKKMELNFVKSYITCQYKNIPWRTKHDN